MNALVDKEIAEGAGNPDILVEEMQIENPRENSEDEEPAEALVEILEVETPENEPTKDPENQDDVLELEPQGDDDSDNEAEDDDTVNDVEDSKDGKVRRSARIKAGVKKPARYAMHTKLRKGKHNDEKLMYRLQKLSVRRLNWSLRI
jgi:hypothetical protein